jgi:hypothetical protein
LSLSYWQAGHSGHGQCFCTKHCLWQYWRFGWVSYVFLLQWNHINNPSWVGATWETHFKANFRINLSISKKTDLWDLIWSLWNLAVQKIKSICKQLGFLSSQAAGSNFWCVFCNTPRLLISVKSMVPASDVKLVPSHFRRGSQYFLPS